MLDDAITRHAASGDASGHAEWIAFLLREYYDGMYEYQLASKAERIVFRGDRNAVLDYLGTNHGIAA